MSDLAWAGGLLAALLGGIAWLLAAARRAGRGGERADRDAETLRRIEAEQAAGADAAAMSQPPEQIVAKGDKKWR